MLLHHRTLVFRVFVAISLLALTFSALGVTPARAAGGPPYMYIANHGGNNIIQATLGGALSATMTLGGLCSGPSSIALDVANSKMYVTCDGNDRVVRANLDGTVPTAIISSGLSAPGGIALDLTNSKIYIANYSNNTISRANLNGSGLASLGNLNGTLNGPVNMTLNVAANKMYVANYDSGAVPSGTISQANLDGTGGVALTLSGLVGGPSDVKLDLTNNKMYVLNGGNNNHIIQANLNGTAAVDLGDLGGALAGPAGIGLDVPNGKMYIADDNGNNKVYQANLNGTGVVNLGNVGGTINSPYAIDLDLTVLAAPTVTSPTATSIAATTATLGATVSSNGGATLTARGTCWGTAAAPTGNCLSDGGTTVGVAYTQARTILPVNTFIYYRGYASNSAGTAYSADGSFWTLTNIPSAPTVNNPTATTLNVAVNVNGNPASTEFCIQETSTGNYVQAGGALGASCVWQTAATWGTKTVTGLTNGTTYTFQAKARNGGLTETAYGTTASGVTSSTYSLGNRVWFDTNNDGLLNGAEVGVSGVRVELYQDNGGTPGVWDAGDTFIGFITTDASGYYRFDGLPAGDYVVKLPAVNFVFGNPLNTYWSSGTSTAANGAVSDSVGPDPDNNVDSDDNGVTTFSGNTINYVSSQAVTLGPGTSEPTNDNDPASNPLAGEAPNNQSNRTVDFGFYRIALSNQIFVDANVNGAYDGGDTTLSGATVDLYASDGVTLLNTVVTGAGGTYLFGGLAAGDYIVKVTPPAGYQSTVDTANSGDPINPNNNIDNNDNGVGTAAGEVSSNTITLTPGNTGAAANNVVSNPTGTTTNPTLDFGFQPFANTTTGLASSQNPSAAGQSVTFTATIAPAAATGTVTFRDGGVNIPGCINVSVSSGQATCATAALTLGAHTITAVYSGDINYSGSTGTLSPNQQVNCSNAITVANNADSGAGSLRQAIADVCAGGTIDFDNDYTILLASQLTINKNLTIDGAGQNVTVSGNHVTRVMNLIGGTINLNHLTIADGYLVDGSYSGISGAGIYVNGATLNVSNSTFSGNVTGWPGGGGIQLEGGAANVSNSTFIGNSANYGGGIDSYSGTTLNVVNSTFSGNSAASAGGGLSVGGVGNIVNSTISGNSSGWADGGGGINSEDGTVTIKNSIIANNPTGNNCWSHYGGPFYGSTNLANDATCGAGFTDSASILLGTLGNYGGSTQTFPLLPGSSAIDAGDSAICAAAPVNSLDQRGVARSSACDIGAFESQGFTLAKTGGDNQSTSNNTAFTNPLALNVTSAFGEPVNGGMVIFTAPSSGASTNPITSTATITNGAVSQGMTANSTAGGPYTVVASAAGVATSVNFGLTNIAACKASITVANDADSGAGSLRQAIADICADGTINFNGSYTITLTSAALTIDKNITITGAGHSVTVSGNNARRVFYVNSGVTATLDNLTVANGNSTGENGGGIYNNGGALTITNSTISGNSAGSNNSGGGIYNNGGALTITNSTISGNSAGTYDVGGGIANWSGTLTVTNSTFSGNSSGAMGGGIYNYSATLNVTNSTFSGNSAWGGGGIANWSGTLTVANSTFSGNNVYSTYWTGSGIDNNGTATVTNTLIVKGTSGTSCHGALGGSNNLADDGSCGVGFTNSTSILLGALGDYGGSTQTIPLLPGSTAIDTGDSATCAPDPVNSLDQRGVTRGTPCDIGAFESQGFTLEKTGGDNQSTIINTAFTDPLVVSVTSAHTEPVNGGIVIFTAPASGASTNPITSTATITNGAVSQSVTANSTAGGPYNVTAGARGATSVNFSLTNNKATATVTLSNLNQTYDGTPKAAGVSTTPNGLTVTVTYNGVATAPTNAGNYGVVATVNDLTYQGSTTGTLTINTVPLTITTNDTSKAYGVPLPTFTVVYSGFVHSETESILSGTLAFDTSATFTSPVGDYAVTPKGLTSTNYAITFIGGTLHILAVNTTISLTSSLNPSMYGQAVTFTATVTSTTSTPIGSMQFYGDGALAGSPVALSNGAASWLTNMLAIGTHVITATYSGDTNFTASSGTLTGGQIVNDQPLNELTAINNSPHRVGNTTFFTATLTTGTNALYQWNFGDGTTSISSMETTTQHTYPAAGAYTAIVTATNGANVLTATTPVDIERARLYLPIVFRNFVNAPDLIVQRINASGSKVQVVIANIGSAPVTDEFWVDVYLNPSTAPTHVNQTWNQLGSQGLLWGVTANALPALQPGGVLTLTLNDAYYYPDLSHVVWPLTVGSPIYAQVDSVNANTTYGAVLENHEISGGSYNNILSSVVASTNASTTTTPSATNPDPASTGLPPRP
jgi:hypothetical protein